MHSKFMHFFIFTTAIFPLEMSFESVFYTHFEEKVSNPGILKKYFYFHTNILGVP